MSPHKPGSDFHFTEKALAALAIPDKGRAFYRDAETEGLTLVVRSSGAKSFAWYKKVNGRPWWERLGVDDFPAYSIEAARAAASDLNKKLNRWKDDGYPEPCPFKRKPKSEPPAKELTLGALRETYIERYLSSHAKNPKRAVKDLRQAFDHHCPTWKDRPLSKITAEDVAALHHKIGASGAKLAANRMVERLRTLYNYAFGAKLFKGDNPALYSKHGRAGVKKFDERKRTRFLSAEEMPAFWRALEASPNADFRDYILVSYFTGARKSDALSMRWSDLDLPRATWTVANPKAKLPYVITLADKVLAVLKAREEKRVPECPWVFPGVGKSEHVVDFKKRWRELLEAAGLDYKNGERERPTLHDLRRSLASHAYIRGVPLQVIQRMLGHRSIVPTQIYAQLDDKVVADAFNATARALDGMRGPKLLAPAPAKRAKTRKAAPVTAKRKVG